MVTSKATTAAEYLDELPDDRRAAIEVVRDTILANLDEGIVETMAYGMLTYELGSEHVPEDHKGTMMVAALASQKNHMAIYLHALYADAEQLAWFQDAYAASGNKLNMGKSCVRFTKLENLPVEVIGEAIARTTVEEVLSRA